MDINGPEDLAVYAIVATLTIGLFKLVFTGSL
jgi:hypothetical protein